MGIRSILKKVFSKDKKVVICGLDNSGKSTLVSFLQTGTFLEHTPTMGKAQTNIEVQGVRLNLVDMGGQKDFRSLWAGEMQNAAIVLFMLDAHDIIRFEEAKQELVKLSSIIKNMPLIILANKQDLQSVASVKQIIHDLELMRYPSFEVLPISSKTGYGIANAFSKIYYLITGKQLVKRVTPKALTIFNQGGVPLTSKEGYVDDIEILRGGLYAALVSFVKESFKSELHLLKLEDNLIILKRTKHLLGAIIIEDSGSVDCDEAESRLSELLEHLENMCPELELNDINTEKIEYLTNEFATNIFN